MRADLAGHALLLAMGLADDRSRVVRAVMLASKLGACNRPAWWRWTTWLAAGITVRRIEAA